MVSIGHALTCTIFAHGPFIEILLATKDAFLQHLTNNKILKYRNLLIPVLEGMLANLQKDDLERATLIGGVKLPRFESDQDLWIQAAEGITAEGEERIKILNILNDFYRSREGLRIPFLLNDANDKTSVESITREIIIPVEVPLLRCICTARLELQVSDTTPTQLSSITPRMLKIGESVRAVLRVQINQTWNLKPTEDAKLPHIIQFYYEMTTTSSVTDGRGSSTSSQDWLVNGKRRAVFDYEFSRPLNDENSEEVMKLVEEEEERFELLLVPLKAGWILLPTVEIRALPYTPEGQGDGEKVTVNCETDYRSGSEGVLVVQEVDERMVRVDHEHRSAGKRPVSVGGEGRRIIGES